MRRLLGRLRGIWTALRWTPPADCAWCGLPALDPIHSCRCTDWNHPARLTCHRSEEAR
jgi:hypothetical protein